MIFSKYDNLSMLNLIFASVLYLLTYCQKCKALTETIKIDPSSLIIGRTINITESMSDEQRLFYTLMNGYEKAVRPVRKASDVVVVKLGLTLTQIMDIVKKSNLSTIYYLIYLG